MRSKVRHDNIMVAIETAPATIDYADILEQTQVIPDDLTEAPWENCCGFEHEVERPTDFTRNSCGCVWCDANRERVLITLPDDEDWGIYEYHRNRGATKQVAAEAIAAQRQRTLAQLVDWYENGWQWYGVKCDFFVLGEEYHASVWGIDDEEYAEKYAREEIASEVAHQLEEAGYTVANKPKCLRGLDARQHKEVWKRNLNSQNWQGE